MALAVAWELLLAAAAFSLLRRWQAHEGERWLGALAVALTVDGLLGTWLTWAGWNHPLVYAAPAAGLCVPAWRAVRERWSWRE